MRTGLVLAASLILAGVRAARADEAMDGDGKKPSAEAATEDEAGPWSAGLRAKAAGPRSASRGDAVAVVLTLEADPKSLPAGVTHLDGHASRALFARLKLSGKGLEAPVEIVPYDPTWGMPDPLAPVVEGGAETDEQREARRRLVRLSAPGPWTLSFPLATVWDALPAGRYEAVVEATFPATAPAWRSDAPKAEKDALWRGTLRTKPWTIEVRESEPRTQTIFVPFKLAVGKGLVVTIDAVEKFEVATRAGFFTGMRVLRDGQVRTLSGLDVAQRAEIDATPDAPRGAWRATYSFEIFETAERPQHAWAPAEGRGGYKTLWTKDLEASVAADERDKLK